MPDEWNFRRSHKSALTDDGKRPLQILRRADIGSSCTLLQLADIITVGVAIEGESVMRTLLPTLAIIVVGGFCGQANAQAQCPELTRLRSEAAEAQKPMARGLISNRCDAYIRSSMAWRAVLQYAEDNREMCGISIRSLGEFEKYYGEAASARDNVCAGRPVRPFPAEIIQR